MTEDITLRLEPRKAYGPEMVLTAEASTHLGIAANRIKGVKITGRSIDARQKRVMVNVNLRVFVDETPAEQELHYEQVEYGNLGADAPQAVIVGAGPAGLFAALRLIERGVRPVVLERGKDVDMRRKDVAQLSRTQIVDPDSNYCFGEGGAGTFSDGKLYTRSTKRGDVGKILRILCQHGADEEILIERHPHIGTNRLPDIIANIRRTIIASGGEVRFSTRVAGLLKDGEGRVTGVETADGERIEAPAGVIVATGHSARDTYRMLLDNGVPIEAKGLAVGVRLEHPQALIDQIRYHNPQGRGRWLPPAEYTLLTRVDGRGVYSFCMCPGGVVIPASSAPGELVVNGMSGSGRTGKWANSGMVVEVLPEDIPGEDPLRMMAWQQQIERAFYADGPSGLSAPAQRMTDFVEGRASATLPASSYPPGIHSSRVDKLLPGGVSRRLREGFKEFGRKQRGFMTPEAIVLGDETRTSAPVRLVRDRETLESLPGLYPAGEGAGYAGGIVSAAIDGDRAAEALANRLG